MSDNTEAIRKLEKKIELLEERIKKLEPPPPKPVDTRKRGCYTCCKGSLGKHDMFSECNCLCKCEKDLFFINY
jgi:hypothetical protein